MAMTTPTFKTEAVNTIQHELTELGSRRKDRLAIAFFADLHLNDCPSESHSYVSRRGCQQIGSSGAAIQIMVSDNDIWLERSSASATASLIDEEDHE